MSRCPITLGKGSLACCRVAEHPTSSYAQWCVAQQAVIQQQQAQLEAQQAALDAMGARLAAVEAGRLR